MRVKCIAEAWRRRFPDSVDCRQQLIHTIRNAVIGRNRVLHTPFGERLVTYADYTASGRSLSFIEEFIQEQVMPLYANVHTDASGTGLHTNRLREEARAIIADAVNASDDDVVIFTGSGATGAINRLVDVLGIRMPASLERRYRLRDQIPDAERPVVFIGPYEHHSNELPWRESIATVVPIMERIDGGIDLAELERQLRHYADRPLKIGSFSAASNVTGILSNAEDIAAMLHQHGAFALFDYAAAAPYVQIDMHPNAGDALTRIDAVFISPHKFVGGPQTPGVLVANRALFTNPVPAAPGGGTVLFVTPDSHEYLDDIVQREEGGTPGIIESIRAGMVFFLKAAVGVDEIQRRERSFVTRAIESWSENPNIEILGNPDADRLSIISFVVRCGDRYLHHNYVVRLLNDLFGIQSRGGCSCAGPYGHRLLGIAIEQSRAFQKELLRGCEGIKPGWVRVSFNYFIGETMFRFLVDAVNFVATHGRKLLPYYRLEDHTGLWIHSDSASGRGVSLFTDLDLRTGLFECRTRTDTAPDHDRDDYLGLAASICEAALQRWPTTTLEIKKFTDEFEELRWFEMPHEALVHFGGASVKKETR